MSISFGFCFHVVVCSTLQKQPPAPWIDLRPKLAFGYPGSKRSASLARLADFAPRYIAGPFFCSTRLRMGLYPSSLVSSMRAPAIIVPTISAPQLIYRSRFLTQLAPSRQPDRQTGRSELTPGFATANRVDATICVCLNELMSTGNPPPLAICTYSGYGAYGYMPSRFHLRTPA